MNASSQTEPVIHYAKVDRWVAVLFGVVTLGEFVAGTAVLVACLLTGSPPPALALGISAALFGVGSLFGLILWGCYHIRCVVTSSDLVVHCGPFRTTLPLDTIVEVFPTRNPMHAPAPSLDRLQISYRKKTGGKWFELISPKDKEAFVRDLASAAPRLHRVEDGPARLKAVEPA
jgi:hypothetical protein